MKNPRWFIPLLVILLLLLIVSAVAAETTYTVQPGEGLSSIAQRFGLDYLTLAAANDIEAPYIIQPGQVLTIPDAGSSPAPPQSPAPAPENPAPQPAAPVAPAAPAPAPSSSVPGTYTIQAGDSLSKIAAQFGTNYLVLAALNDLEEPYIVAIGQTIQVPGAPAAPVTDSSPAAAPNEAPAAQPPAAVPPAAAPPPVAAPSYGGSFELGGQTQSFSNKQLMKDVGMNWVKFQHKWSPGDSPDAVAGRIADAHANGFKVLLSIPGANTYPAPGGIDFNSYVNFLGGVAALGPDAIEVWNEENIDFEWPAGEIDPKSYVNNMLAPAYNAIKSANPNVMVIGGALAPTGFDNGTNAWADNRYLAGMAAAGAARYMDCMGVHHNAGATSPAATSGHPGGGHYSWYFKPTMDLYYNSFGGAVKVCFTELGYLSQDGFSGLSPAFGWAAENSVDEHAQWLADAVRIAQNSGKTRLVIIFNIDFTNYDPNGDPQAGYAIVRPGGACPACDALRR
ncbi:MAG: LysM peptidoglycan-binding domain-containing protein [Candidatus Promineifilaceae bacterium]|nr:LysM peptidoglycan-binding domain-containing protein [Candidatus Promineifilaceae bacterium]